jgi:uncharacterized protein YndB with AHSA1/START domain/DNA-binding transcriptional ArsR family regulator
VDAALKALADPHRRRILELVADGELTAGRIAEQFSLTRPAVSQHLAVLVEAGLLDLRREGTRRLYRTRRAGFAGAVLLLEGFWDDRLGRLLAAVERGRADQGDPVERVCVERDVLLRATPEVVWTMLTDAEAATGWMGVSARIDARPGGEYRVEVVPGEVVEGEVLVAERPTRLVHTWGWVGPGSAVAPGTTVVTYELAPLDGGTLLRLTHRDLPTMRAAGSHSRGWAHYLDRLTAVAGSGDAGPDPWATDPGRLLAELHP